MRSNNVVGIVFSNVGDEALPELTSNRTMASVPIGGKYRTIDFTLSNFSNSGINNVCIIANKNFISLMDHVGSGKAWDLSRKRSGLSVLPPYNGKDYSNMLEMIYNIKGYLEHCDEEYVLLCNSNFITNVDYTDLFDFYEEKNAEAVFVYANVEAPEGIERPMVIKKDENDKIEQLFITPDVKGVCSITLGTLLISKKILFDLITDSLSKNETNEKIFMRNITQKHNTYAFENKGYFAPITSMKEYFNVNMDLMNADVRKELFQSERPIYTKVRDDTPCQYGLSSSVKNSLISQGCVIKGTVENCVISKGVFIDEGAVVKNSIIMQDTKIGRDVNLNYVVIDKDVIVNDGRSLMGYESYPVYISKKSNV